MYQVIQNIPTGDHVPEILNTEDPKNGEHTVGTGVHKYIIW